jgi:hypothetical protein
MRHPKIDFADLHYYYRPSEMQKHKDEVAALLDRTRFLLQNSPNKPAHLGEFGLANEKFQPTDEMRSSKETVEFHNAMWASALSGASGTCMFWWWERLDKNDAYPHYRPLSAFLADIPWTAAGLRTSAASVAKGMRGSSACTAASGGHSWLFNPQAAWRSVVIDKTTRDDRDAPWSRSRISNRPYRMWWTRPRQGDPQGRSPKTRLQLPSPPRPRHRLQDRAGQ